MSHNGVEGSKPGTPSAASPQRSRHQLSRSISELSSPIRLHRHHSHRDRERERDGLTPVPSNTSSAMASTPQNRLSLESSRSDRVTPNLSPNPSRRTSILAASLDDSSSTAATAAASVTAPPVVGSSTAGTAAAAGIIASVPTKNINGSSKTTYTQEEELVHERQLAVARESGLKQSLASLQDFSTATTRRLDDTYYSVLEKLGALQSTILGLKELAVLSQEMNRSFGSEAAGLAADVHAQLDAFGKFETQQRRIETLQDRVHVGRDKIRALSERVDVVRERIEGWERADREWQERTRKRLRVVWLLTVVVLVFVVMLVVGAQWGAAEGGVGGGGIGSGSVGEVRDGVVGNGTGTGAGMGDIERRFWSGGKGTARKSGKTAEGTESSREPARVDTTDVLRVFDEL
ncbi:hypothetical protein B0T22DRAFT_453550 [Podospora appendiculata]|uniref:Uncharacterized protein n=1 Tax=Podospora appendiculata TaxID=314037 RepID=A0AAE0XK00_9PEZI|nr:hypothetical protein B0T22DRAFT_453550 [Podospora appendiculata]